MKATPSNSDQGNDFLSDVLASTRGDARGRPILLDDEHFVVVPTLGPLHPSHLLICARKVRTGLHQMTDLELSRLHDIICAIELAFSRLCFGSFVMFENGTATNGRSGCSIVQYHLHVVPTTRPFDLEMAASLASFEIVEDLARARDTARALGDYLFVKLPRSRPVMCSRRCLPSQHMRRVVGRSNGVEVWDWRVSEPVGDWTKRENLRTVAEAIRQEISLNASDRTLSTRSSRGGSFASGIRRIQ